MHVLKFLGVRNSERDPETYSAFRSAVWAALFAATDLESLRELIWTVLDGAYHQGEDAVNRVPGVYNVEYSDGLETVEIDGGFLKVLKDALWEGDTMTALYILEAVLHTVYKDPRMDFPWCITDTFETCDAAIMSAADILVHDPDTNFTYVPDVEPRRLCKPS